MEWNGMGWEERGEKRDRWRIDGMAKIGFGLPSFLSLSFDLFRLRQSSMSVVIALCMRVFVHVVLIWIVLFVLHLIWI